MTAARTLHDEVVAKARRARKTHLRDPDFPHLTFCGRSASKSQLAAEAGLCRVCNCTDGRACKGGCSWVDASETLCSSCKPILNGAPSCRWCRDYGARLTR